MKHQRHLPAPGALQFGITPEKLTKPHESKPWNPLIAQAFYRRGIIESWGRGTLKIWDLLAAAVSVGLTMLYWRIGKRIREEILKGHRAEYGKQIVVSLTTIDHGVRLPVVDNFRTFEWPKPEMLEALYTR